MGEVAEIEMLSKPDVLGLKQNLVGKATERLVEELKVVEASQKNAQSNATHSESKQESDKDMRATEASYVARGLAKRCLLYTSPSPRDATLSRMPSSA